MSGNIENTYDQTEGSSVGETPNDITNDTTNQRHAEINKDVILMQQFTAACVALLKMLKRNSETKLQEFTEEPDPNPRAIQAYSRFNESVDRYVASLQDGSFDFQKILRKIFDVLKTEESTQMVRESDSALFELRNEQNKIVSILPGINIRLTYSLLSEEDKIHFWQYFHLMALSTFNIFHHNNPRKVASLQHVMEMIHEIGQSLEKTGIMVDDKIFNPYLGLGGSAGVNYGTEEMFANTVDLQTGEQLSLEAVLNTLGVGNLVNEEELNAKLESLKESDLEVATDQIVNILGAGGDPNTRNVCSKLVRNIVEELKINGIANVGNVLKSVAEKSKSEIQVSDMRNTMGYVQSFMNDGQDKLKDMKDENGNPIGEQVLNTISTPMAMMKAMGMGQMVPPPPNNDEQE
jgi:predicted transcriptional regulator YheO